MYAIQAKPRKNSKKFSKTIAEFKKEADVINYLEKNNIKATDKPYIFTHINLDNGQILTSFYRMLEYGKYKEIICSPEKIAKLLNL